MSSRFLRRADLAAALAGTAALALPGLCVISDRFSHPSPQANAAATRGHLGLVRAHPGLRDLNAAFSSSSRDALFLDAAHALAASALRSPTMTGHTLRGLMCVPDKDASAAEPKVGLQVALLHAREGRFDEALADLARLAGDSPDNPRPRVAAAALCFLQGRSETARGWLRKLPKEDTDLASQFEFDVVLAMPGSSPPSAQAGVDGMAIWLATNLAETTLMHCDKGEWHALDKLVVSLHLSQLRLFAHKHLLRFRAAGAKLPVTRSTTTPPPAASLGGLDVFLLVECSQAILASLLRARPLCGERLRSARYVAERALLDAEADGDVSAAVDVNLVLAFLAARDGDFDEALRRYKAAVQKDPSDSRPYELTGKLCLITGRTAESDAWRRDGGASGHAAELPAGLLDELVIAAALGSGVVTTLGRRGQGGIVLLAAWREVDAGLAAALVDKDLTSLERYQIRVLRSSLRISLEELLGIAIASH